MNLEHQIVCTLANQPELVSSIDLSDSDFGDRKAAKIYSVVRQLAEDRRTPEPVLVAELLEEQDGTHWLPDVVDMFSGIQSPRNVDIVQERIKSEARRRGLRRAGEQFLQDLDKPNAVSEFTSRVEKIDAGSVSGIRSGRELMTELVTEIEELQSGTRKPGVSTGFNDLDYISGGLIPGESVVVCARTSVGKTAFMCNLAANVQEPVGIISGEQSGKAIIRRLAANIGRIDMQRMRKGTLTDIEQRNLVKAQERVIENYQVVDASRPSISHIENTARTMVWSHGIQVLFVDYLQLIHNSNFPNDRRLQVSDISARLKAIARDLDIPVVCLAQLNRGAVDHTPRISDLKESGAIEEDADQIHVLYRAENQPANQITLHVQKNREGMTGTVPLFWQPEYMTFREIADEF